MTGRATFNGTPEPGVNLDRIDVAAGVAEAAEIGYGSPEDVMVVGYAMKRWARGEEDGGMRTMMSHGIDLTSAYRIVAAARASATK